MTPPGCPFYPSSTGSYKPIIPGSITTIGDTADPVQRFIDEATRFDDEWTGGTGGNFQISDLLAVLYSLDFNLQSLMLFGSYINDFVAKARAGDDSALLKAIKVDASVVTGPTASKRIARAVAEDDRAFVAKLSKAMAGKTGHQRAYLRKFRLVMTVLGEAGAFSLPIRELETLVFDLGLYSSAPGSQKNVRELVRKFMKTRAISE